MDEVLMSPTSYSRKTVKFVVIFEDLRSQEIHDTVGKMNQIMCDMLVAIKLLAVPPLTNCKYILDVVHTNVEVGSTNLKYSLSES